MENNVTLEILRQEAMNLLKDNSIHVSTRNFAIRFINENKLLTCFTPIWSSWEGLDSYIGTFFVPVFETITYCGGSISSSHEDIPDDIIFSLNKLKFHKIGCRFDDEKRGNYKYCETLKFPGYNDLYKHISELTKRKNYEVCIICFYMITEMIAEVISEVTFFYKNEIPDDLFEKSTINEVIDYFLDLYKMSFDDNDYFLKINLPHLICYLFHKHFWGYYDIEKLIDDCFNLSKAIIENNKKKSFVGELKSITERNSFAAAVEKYLSDRKAAQEEAALKAKRQEEEERERKNKLAKEAKERENQDYIYKIVNHSKTVLSDPNIESAINRLIVTISVDTLLSIERYNVLRLCYINNTKLREIINPYEEYTGWELQELSDLRTILVRRYNLPEEYSTEITWCVFNYCIIKKYSKKWIDICVTGEIGDRSLETYLSDCFNDDMISLDDEERIALFCYYIASLKETDDLFFDFFLQQPEYTEYVKIKELLSKYKDENRTATLESKLFGNIGSSATEKAYYTIDDIDLMTGVEFENFIKKLFIAMGYSADTTKASGDQGIDVIVEKNGIKYGIQAKCYSGTVSNSAVQEAVAGRLYYGLDKVIVITNSTFTKSAKKLAASNGAVLWDRSILTEKLIYVN